MPNYLAPGVYIEEIPTGSRPIEAVGTSVAGFIGRAPKVDESKHQAVWFDNWGQFCEKFAPDGSTSTPLSHGVYGFFLNGGTRCCVVNIGTDESIAGGGKPPRKGLDIFEESEAISIIAAPGYSDPGSYEAMLAHCEKLQNRIAILDGPPDLKQVKDDFEALKRVATVRTKASGGGASAASDDLAGLKPRLSARGFGVFYFPHLTVYDPLSKKRETVNVAPSGYIAGIYARTDALRGVHKAPANESINGAVNLTYRVTRQEQEQLNPEGVNCIRFFSREGIKVFGARTLAASASEWRYVNVRRLCIMLEQSISRSLSWAVFEPNNYELWKSISRDVGHFLSRVYSDGALFGRTAQEAFFVQCDDETNPEANIDAGIVTTRIGVAPVKPAEFVVFKIGQGTGGTRIEIEG